MEDSKKEEAPKRKFALGFLMSFGILTVLIGALNGLIDPYQFSKSRLEGVNDVFSNENFRGEKALTKAFNFASRADEARVSMVGTSHLKRGFSITSGPGFEVFALSDLKLAEAIDLLQIIIDESKVSKTILIEVGRNLKSRRSDKLTWNERFFSLKTTIKSIRMIGRSIELRDADYKYKVRDIVPGPMPKLEYYKNQREEIVKGIVSDEIPLDSLFARVDINNSDLEHTVIFFTSPLPFGLIRELELQEIVESRQHQLQQRIEALNSDSKSVKFKFLGFWGTSLFEDYRPWTDSFLDGWYDDDHYKPVIGDQLLNQLMQLSEVPLPD